MDKWMNLLNTSQEIGDVSFSENFAYIPNEWTLVAMFESKHKT